MKSFRWIYVKYCLIMALFISLFSLLFSTWITSTFEYILTYSDRFLLIVIISVFIGLCVGVYSSITVNKSIRTLHQRASDVVKGNHAEEKVDYLFKEFYELENSIKKLAEINIKQALQMQEKTNRSAEEKQTIFEEAIMIERGRLARELHDSVSQQLFAISMMSSAVHAGLDDDNPMKQHVSKLEYMANQAQSEMRALLLHLRPVQLEGKKLSVGIHELLTELSAKQNLDVRWQLDDLTFAIGVEDHLFRMMQEAISNTLRHAKATKLEISLKKSDNTAIMRIFDDGIGFEMDDRNVGSYGLETMKERAIEMGGTLKIMSVKNQGTQIEIKVPIRKDE